MSDRNLGMYYLMPAFQNSWTKRHLYVQVVVELISIVTKKPDAQNLSYSDALSPLFETVVNIGTYGMMMPA